MATPTSKSLSESQTAALPDPELAAVAGRGDRAAFEQLVRRFTGRLLALCRQLMSDRAEAEDRLQEAWVKVHRQLPRYDPGRPLAPWLFKIAQNCCIDALRRRRAWDPLVGDIPTPAPPRPHHLEDRLERAIAGLPAKHRLVLHYKYALGYNAAEIAEQLELSHPDVRVCLHRAIQLLRERLSS